MKDFENMFREKEEYNSISGSGTKLRSTIQGIRNYLPTSVQAEILISGVILIDTSSVYTLEVKMIIISL